MKKLTLLKSMLLLCALVAGSGSVWADESTIDVRNLSSVVFEPKFGTDGTSYKSTAFTLTSNAKTTYSGWSRTNVACGDSRMAVKASGSFTSPTVYSASGYSVEITYTFSSTSSASVSIKIGDDEAVSSTSEGTLKAITTTKNATFKITAGSTRAVYITKLEIKPYPEVPAESFDALPVATISHETCSYSKPTWTHNDNSDYTLSDGATDIPTKVYDESYTRIKLSYGKTYTITVPSSITVTKVGITGASTNTSTGTQITIGSTEETFKTLDTKIYNIASPSAGTSVTFTVAAKEFGLESIVLYAADGKILETSTNMDGWRTFYESTSQKYEVDANTKIYIATTTAANDVVELTQVAGTVVPANAPVILKTSAVDHKIVLTKSSASPADLTGNLLTVTDGSSNADGYRLGYGSIGVGFYKYTTATAPAAGIVYIDKSNVNLSGGAHGLAIVFDEEAGDVTAIKSVNADQQNVAPRKVMKDGRIVIESAKGTFTMSGARMK